MNFAVFCDFDGTVTTRDVGYNLFHHFSQGKNDELLPDWKSGRISTRECLRLEASMVKATPQEIYAFLQQFEIDKGFKDFVNFCDHNHMPLLITSDGLDFYIRFLLQKYQLSRLNFLSNIGHLENGGITLAFPHHNIHCTRCGICKGEVIEQFRTNSEDKYKIIFIGDGYSDICATQQADIIFAKKDLEQYCLKKNIHYYAYETFYDIKRQMLQLGYTTEKK
ncbi:MAG: MtnX-like HAD-IB family phosphatase [FCB group bacterium]|nr:MtnX-like HAD-IB family phosphatase [FCB group bacterium]